MLCKNCGTENPEQNLFCQNCGSKIEADAATAPEAEVVATEATPVADTPVQDSAPAQQPIGYTYQQPNNSFNQQPNFYAAPYQAPVSTEDEHVSVGGWIGRMLIYYIPCVGPLVYLIMLFVWAFGGTPKKSLKNFAKAQLILIAIIFAIAIVVIVVCLALGISLGESMAPTDSYYYY